MCEASWGGKEEYAHRVDADIILTKRYNYTRFMRYYYYVSRAIVRNSEWVIGERVLLL